MNRVYLVDFGLAVRHLDVETSLPFEQNMEHQAFKGTISYASLNAHDFADLSRRDDLWSFFFLLLEFLGEELPWRADNSFSLAQVKELKTRCLADPEQHLYSATRAMPQVNRICNEITRLQFKDKPDYQLIKQLIQEIIVKAAPRQVLDMPAPSSVTSTISSQPQYLSSALGKRSRQLSCCDNASTVSDEESETTKRKKTLSSPTRL